MIQVLTTSTRLLHCFKNISRGFRNGCEVITSTAQLPQACKYRCASLFGNMLKATLTWVILSAAKLPQTLVWRRKVTTVKCDCNLVKWLFKISNFHASTLEEYAAMLLGWRFLIFWKSCAFVISEYINVVTPHQKTVTQSHSITSRTMWTLIWPVNVSCTVFIYGIKSVNVCCDITCLSFLCWPLFKTSA